MVSKDLFPEVLTYNCDFISPKPHVHRVILGQSRVLTKPNTCYISKEGVPTNSAKKYLKCETNAQSFGRFCMKQQI